MEAARSTPNTHLCISGVLIAILVVLVFLVWEVALFINNDHLKNAARGDSPIHTRFLAVRGRLSVNGVVWQVECDIAPAPLPKTSLTPFSQVGDWGRDGKHNQSLVASAMALKAATFQPDFIVSTGDKCVQGGILVQGCSSLQLASTTLCFHPGGRDALIDNPFLPLPPAAFTRAV